MRCASLPQTKRKRKHSSGATYVEAVVVLLVHEGEGLGDVRERVGAHEQIAQPHGLRARQLLGPVLHQPVDRLDAGEHVLEGGVVVLAILDLDALLEPLGQRVQLSIGTDRKQMAKYASDEALGELWG